MTLTEGHLLLRKNFWPPITGMIGGDTRELREIETRPGQNRGLFANYGDGDRPLTAAHVALEMEYLLPGTQQRFSLGHRQCE